MDINSILSSFGVVGEYLFSVNGMSLLLIGTIIGSTAGSIPGLGAMTTLALLLPFTYGWGPLDAMILLSAVCGSVTVGGSVAAILINAPGTDSNIATTIDGYPLAQQGRAIEALGTAALASLFGSIIGLLIFLPMIPVLGKVSLAFGPPEVFWLGVFTLVVLSTVTGGSFLVNLLVGSLAFVLSTHGLGPISGVPRFTFGITYLWGGIPLVPALVGIFAVSEMAKLYSQQSEHEEKQLEIKGSRKNAIKNILINYPLVFRSSLLGFIIGAIPGVGGTVANYLAYGQAVQFSKDRSKFGKGDVRGIIAPEASNNAKDVGQLVPTLTLGIPGSGTMAIFLGVLTLHGLNPGPFLLRDHLDIVTMIVLSLAMAFIISCFGVFWFGKYLAKLLKIENRTICLFVVVICFLASFFIRNQIIDCFVMVIFGVLGYFTDRLKGSRVLLALPIILGPIIENNLVLANQISGGDISYFLSKISVSVILLTFFSILFPMLKRK